MRVGEDHDDDLYEAFGIEEWSIDDFEYVRKLGNGGLANVYLAHEIQSGHPVALKVQHAQDSAFCELDIHQELSDGMKDCRDVDNTSNSILKLIGYFYSNEKFGPEDDDVPGEGDLGECDGHVYLYTILEFCEGGDLHDAIDLHGEVPEELAAKYMACAIRALEHLHSKSIIHCDVKPSNFLLCKDDNVKLADFGMSVRSTEKEIVGGSPVYMAPEHLMAWRHHSDDFDHRVDIYSLGVVMYELLMGYLPYDVIEAPRDENGYLISSRTQGSSDPDDDSDKDDYELDSVFPVLDLRNFKDSACTEPIVVPAPVFMDEISEEAEDLIHHFLESDKDRRITLAEAKQHKWFKKFALEYDTECMDG
jgi:serine/threonine protein kinase